MKQETEGSVEVVIRLQPPQASHLLPLSENVLQCINKNYGFDMILTENKSQEEVFERIGLRMITSAKKGYNSCIFAYGQTGSGKTYTMSGNEREYGLIQRCLKKLWEILQDVQSYELKMNYFEIYNEQVNDLLSDKKAGQIKIKQSLALGFYLQNMQPTLIESEAHLLRILESGIRNRTTAETKMNRQSSRSHSILTMHITMKEKKNGSNDFSIKTSKMHFVDLAGSEKQKSTHVSGERLKQASSINKSLSALSLVIEKLSNKATHIPYRDSILTKILRDSLGGNSRTFLIATLSSKQNAIPETISTLNFATKAKKVKLSAKINEQFDGSNANLRKRIKQLQEEVLRLKNGQKCLSCENTKREYSDLVQTQQKTLQELDISHAKIIEIQKLLQDNYQKVQNQYPSPELYSQLDLSAAQQVQSLSQGLCLSNHSRERLSSRITQLQELLARKNIQYQQLVQKKAKIINFENLIEKNQEFMRKGNKLEWMEMLQQVQYQKMMEYKKKNQMNEEKWKHRETNYLGQIQRLNEIIERKESQKLEHEEEAACFGVARNSQKKNEYIVNHSQILGEIEMYQLMENDLKKDIENYKAEITRIETDLEEQRTLSEYWEKQYLIVKGDREEYQRSSKTRKQNQNDLKHRIKLLEEQLRHEKAKLETETNHKTQSQSYFTELQQQLFEKTERNLHLDKEISILSQQLKSFKHNLQQAEQKNTQIKKELNSMKNEKNQENLNIKIEELNLELKKKEKQIQFLVEQNKQFRRQNAELKNQCSLKELKAIELIEKNQNLSKKLSSLKESFRNDQTIAMKQKQCSNETISMLKQQVRRYEERKSFYERERTINIEDKNYWRKQYENLKRREEELKVSFNKQMKENYERKRSVPNQQDCLRMVYDEIKSIVVRLCKIFDIQVQSEKLMDEMEIISNKVCQIQETIIENKTLKEKCEILMKERNRNSGSNLFAKN